MCSIVSEALGPNGLCLPGSSVPEISQERTLKWVAFLLSRDLAGDPYPRIEPPSSGSHALAAGFFTTEPPENLVRNVEKIKMVSGCHGLQSRGYEYCEFRTKMSSCETVVMNTSNYTFAQTLEWTPLEKKPKVKLETLFHVFLDSSLVTNVNTGGEISRKTVHMWEKYVYGKSLYLTLNSALKLNHLRYWFWYMYSDHF